MNEAGESVAGVAADALRGVLILFVQADSKRGVKRLEPLGGEVFCELLQARFMRDGWEGVGRGTTRFRWVFTGIAVHFVEFFRRRVVGFELVVPHRPLGRDAAVMAEDTEILLAHAEERRAVELGVASYVVVGVGMERHAFAVVPVLFRLVKPLRVDELGVPVRLLTRDVVAALEHKDVKSGRCQLKSEGAATGAGTNDDDVVCHDA